MQVHESFHTEIARQRMDEAERIAARMGFHSAFVRATAAQSLAAERARAQLMAEPGWIVAAGRWFARRRSHRAAAARCTG